MTDESSKDVEFAPNDLPKGTPKWAEPRTVTVWTKRGEVHELCRIDMILRHGGVFQFFSVEDDIPQLLVPGDNLSSIFVEGVDP